jgi:hypothetical protein
VSHFAAEYENCLKFVDYQVIAGATHDMKTMLTTEVQQGIRRLLRAAD